MFIFAGMIFPKIDNGLINEYAIDQYIPRPGHRQIACCYHYCHSYLLAGKRHEVLPGGVDVSTVEEYEEFCQQYPEWHHGEGWCPAYTRDWLPEEHISPESFDSLKQKHDWFPTVEIFMRYFYGYDWHVWLEECNRKLTAIFGESEDLLRPSSRIARLSYSPVLSYQTACIARRGLIASPRFSTMRHLGPWNWGMEVEPLLIGMNDAPTMILRNILVEDLHMVYRMPLAGARHSVMQEMEAVLELLTIRNYREPRITKATQVQLIF